MKTRTILLWIALGILSSAAFAQVSVDEFLAARKKYEIPSVLNASNFRTFTGTNYFELRCTIKGYISSRGDTLMVETVDGLKLNVRSNNTPDFIRRTMQLVRMICKISRPALGSDVEAELVLATDDGPIADHDGVLADEAEKKARRQGRVGFTPSRSGSRNAPAGQPGNYVSLEGPIGGDPQRDQQVLNPPTASVTPNQPMTVDMAFVVGAYATYIQQTNRRLARTTAEEYASYVIQFSQEVGLDPRLLIAVITAESDFNPRETSNKGAMGLVQLMPDEAERFGLSNAYDPQQNIRASAHLLREGIDKYSQMGFNEWDSMVLALAGYNAGHGAVKKYGYKVPPYRETQNYVAKITRLYKQFTGS